jgi:DNA-binding CsgD family transcriptional regulator
MERKAGNPHPEDMAITAEPPTQALLHPIGSSVAGHIGDACAHLAVGRADDARSAAETALHRAESSGFELLVPVAEFVLALVAADNGESPGATTRTSERRDPSLKAVDGGRCTASRRGRRSRWGWESLTETEHRVATTVAEGLTNSQTGARLLQSRHTVDFHLRQIYRKLDISSRVQLTRLVLEHASEQADDGAVNSSASL